MERSSSGSRDSVERLRPTPYPESIASSPGRANTRTKMGNSRVQSIKCSKNPSRLSSAWCASSMRMTTGATWAKRSKNSRQPA